MTTPMLAAEQRRDLCGGYRAVFWGTLLLMVHINVGTLSLLPPFVCYLLIAFGCGRLRKGGECSAFGHAAALACALALLNAVEFLWAFFGGGFVPPMPLLVAGSALPLGLWLCVFYCLLSASAELLRQAGDSARADKLESDLRLLLVFDTVTSCALVWCLVVPQAVLVVLTMIVMFVLRVWLLSLFSSLRKRFDDTRQVPDALPVGDSSESSIDI